MGINRIRISRFFKLSFREKMLFAEAFILQLLIGLVLKFVPFRFIPRLFTNPSPLKKSNSSPSYSQSELKNHLINSPSNSTITSSYHSTLAINNPIPDQLKSILQMTSPLSPWRNKCLVSSLTARCMLKRRKISSELYLGVGKNEAGKVIAHAWIISGGVDIVPKGKGFMDMKIF